MQPLHHFRWFWPQFTLRSDLWQQLRIHLIFFTNWRDKDHEAWNPCLSYPLEAHLFKKRDGKNQILGLSGKSPASPWHELSFWGQLVDLRLHHLLLHSSGLPEVSLVCDSCSYLHSAYSEVDRTDTGHRTNGIYTSEWIIQIAKSKRGVQPLPVTWEE